jgi:hypothetical protein
MKKILMIYNIPQGKDSTRISFNREMFDYRIQTNNGKYDKTSNGLLKNCEKPVRSTVIFDYNLLEPVKKICEKYKISTKFYEIIKIQD